MTVKYDPANPNTDVDALAKTAGVSSAAVAAEQVRTEGSGINPDALVGNLAGQPKAPASEQFSLSNPAGGVMNFNSASERDAYYQANKKYWSDPNPIASTSDAADAANEATGVSVNTASSGLTSTSQQAYDQAFGILEGMAKASEQDRANSIANIERQRGIDVADTTTSQRQEKGATTMGLARMGGYLGGTGSGTSYMNSLAGSHRFEMTKLEAQYAAAVEKAKAAWDMKDIALAGKMVESAQAYQADIEKARDQSMAEMDFALKIEGTEKKMVSDTLDEISKSDIVPPDSYFANLDKRGKYTAGTSKAMWDAMVKAKAIAKETDLVAKSQAEVNLQNDIIDLTSKLPPNQSVTIGGIKHSGTLVGTKYLGYKVNEKTGDVAIIEQDVATGKTKFTVQKGVLEPNVTYTMETFDDGSLWHVPDDPNKPAVPVLRKEKGAGVNTEALFETYPNGQKPVGTNDGWCLQFAYTLADEGSIPTSVDGLSMDTIEAKRKWADASLNVNNITAGSWVLTNEDPKWGHIALVKEIRTNEKGEKVAILTESNGPGSAGKVNHYRVLKLTEDNMADKGGKIMGFHEADLKDGLTGQTSQAFAQDKNGNGDQKKMEEEARGWVAKLSNAYSNEGGNVGSLWGEAFDYLKAAYSVPDEYNWIIDEMLNKEKFYPKAK